MVKKTIADFKRAELRDYLKEKEIWKLRKIGPKKRIAAHYSRANARIDNSWDQKPNKKIKS